jgi:hypothetical protein
MNGNLSFLPTTAAILHDTVDMINLAFPLFVNIHQYSPLELRYLLLSYFGPHHDLQQVSLAAQYEYGFNDHGRNHIGGNAIEVDELLQTAGFDIKTRRRATVATVFHDMGNILSRKVHHQLSVLYRRNLFPGLAAEDAHIVDTAILAHNESFHREILQRWGSLPAKKRIEKMREEFSPEAFALIIADKNDVGPQRVNAKANYQRALDEHHHSLVNAVWTTDKASLSEDGERFNWVLQFDPTMSGLDRNKHAALQLEGTDFVAVPEKFREDDKKTPSFFRLREVISSFYADRILYSAEAAFALFPQLQEFVIHFRNQPTYGESTVISQEFTRENLDEKIREMLGV